MKIQDMCDINFNGKFIEPKISKKAYKAKNMLQDILHTKIDNKSNTELIKNLPFDVYIYCKKNSPILSTKSTRIHSYAGFAPLHGKNLEFFISNTYLCLWPIGFISALPT